MLDVQTSDKTKLLQDMCNQGTGEMALDPQVTSTELLKRGELGSTGVGLRTGDKHARIPGLNKFGVLARVRKPVDFAAIDGQPVDLGFLSGSLGGEQLNALATVARQLRKRSFPKSSWEED